MREHKYGQVRILRNTYRLMWLTGWYFYMFIAECLIKRFDLITLLWGTRPPSYICTFQSNIQLTYMSRAGLKQVYCTLPCNKPIAESSFPVSLYLLVVHIKYTYMEQKHHFNKKNISVMAMVE